MKSCRTASVYAMGVLSIALAVPSGIAACREASKPAEVPPLTMAVAPPASGVGVGPSALPEHPRGQGDGGPVVADDASTAALLAAGTATEPPITASFVDAPGKIDTPLCTRLLIAIAKGKVIAMGETLTVGDVMVVTHPDPIKLEGTGLVLVARRDFEPDVCGVKTRPALDKRLVRANAAPELRWAGGTMSGHLDVVGRASPDVYLGRLEGTAAVAEHDHPASWEILAAVEANGTFVLDSTEGHLGARQIIVIAPGSKHAWKPEPGSKLVAIQMYSPPGPEQRFVALAAAEKDAGARQH